MVPDLGLVVAAGSVVTFTMGLGVIVLRPPACRGCGRPAVGEARAIADAHPALVEVIYRCRRCDARVSRRTLGHPGA
jgi:hypothetical protein